MSNDVTTPEATTGRTRTGSWRGWTTVALLGLNAYSAALGWQAQAVSYPLYRAVAEEDFLAYHAQYNASIPLVVIVPGFVTFLASAAYPWLRPAQVPRGVAAVVGAAGATSLLTTVLWAIPRHDELDRVGRDADVIASLLDANLVRTVALTAATLALGLALGRARSARHG